MASPSSSPSASPSKTSSPLGSSYLAEDFLANLNLVYSFRACPVTLEAKLWLTALFANLE